MSTKDDGGAGSVEPTVRPRAPHVDAVMKHVYRVIGAGAQWTHEHIAAIETELWRVLDEERNAERGFTVSQLAEACISAEIPDSKFESLLIALEDQRSS